MSGSARFAGTGAGAGKIVLELRDPYGRLLDVQEQDADFNSSGTAAFEFKIENWLALVGFVRARAVIDGRTVYAKDSAEFVVTPAERGFTDYEVVPWGFSSTRNLWPVKAQKYREMGATLTGGINRTAMRYGFGAKGDLSLHTLGIYFFDRARTELQDRWDNYKKTAMTDEDKRKLLWRGACLSKAEVVKKQNDSITQRAADQVKYNPGTYYIGDESSLTSYGMEAELCYTDECLARFSEWLKTQYPTLEALNKKWKTQFADWAAIMPPSIVEAQRDSTWAAWADHRTFMEIIYAENLKQVREELHKVDPAGEMELTGTQTPTSFNGMDWARHLEHVKRFVPYSGNFMWDMCRTLSDGVQMVALTGYGSKGDGVKNSLWLQAFQGLSGANIFWEWSLVDADMTLSQNAVDIGEVFNELRGDGIGRLISQCAWQPNDIAIHYSMASIHAARLLNKENMPTQCRNGWCQLAQDLYYQFDFISYLQIERGQLQNKGYKVLILPHTLALSAKEAAEIRVFVQAGGLLIADTDCGLYDEHCSTADPLAGLFDRNAAGTLKPVGSGQTLYYGKTIEWYPGKRLDPEGEQLRTEIEAIFSKAGAKRRAELKLAGTDTLLPRAEAFFLANGPLKVTCLLKENLGGKRTTTADGVEYFIPYGDDVAKPVDTVNADFGLKSHVYDLRGRQYLGYKQTLDFPLVSAEAKIFSHMPYKVEAVKFAMPGTVAAGHTVEGELAIVKGEGPRTAETCLHVFNVKVFDPQGSRVSYYDRNITTVDGLARLVLPWALNAEKGAWKVVVRDVATGVEAVRTLTVTE